MDHKQETHLTFLELSPVKRDRIRKEQAIIKKKALRQELPVYNAQEIRKLRLDYHEALYLNFEENDCPNSAELLRNLIDYQEELRLKSGPQSLFWSKPILKHNRKILDELVVKMEMAEKAHIDENYAKEWETFLQMGADYGFGSEDWHWVGKQFLYICCTFDYANRDFRRYRALSNYLLGRYLIRNDKILEDAKPYLEISREMAQDKHWSAIKYVHVKEETIFMESSGLLYEVLYQEAKVMMKTDPAAAIKICSLARKRAGEACHHYDEFTAYLLKGNCEMMLNEYNTAITTFRKALHVAMARGFTTAVCEARIQIAIVYLQMRKRNEAIENLQELKKFAEDNMLPYYVARAHRFLGEFFLNEGDVSTATALLEVAFHLFDEIQDFENRSEVRNLLAISAGQRGYAKYTELIRSCDGSEESQGNLLKLLRWKENREPFSSESDSTLESTISFDRDGRISLSRNYDYDERERLSIGDGNTSEVKVLMRSSMTSSEIVSIFGAESAMIRSASRATTITTSQPLPHAKGVEELPTLGGTTDDSSRRFSVNEEADAASISTGGTLPKYSVSKSEGAVSKNSVQKSEGTVSKIETVNVENLDPEQHRPVE